jgi:hypothetical protein
MHFYRPGSGRALVGRKNPLLKRRKNPLLKNPSRSRCKLNQKNFPEPLLPNPRRRRNQCRSFDLEVIRCLEES